MGGGQRYRKESGLTRRDQAAHLLLAGLLSWPGGERLQEEGGAELRGHQPLLLGCKAKREDTLERSRRLQQASQQALPGCDGSDAPLESSGAAAISSGVHWASDRSCTSDRANLRFFTGSFTSPLASSLAPDEMPLSLDVPDRGSLPRGPRPAKLAAKEASGPRSWEAGDSGVGDSVTHVCDCEGTVPSWTTTSPHSEASSVNSPRSAIFEPHSARQPHPPVSACKFRTGRTVR